MRQPDWLPAMRRCSPKMTPSEVRWSTTSAGRIWRPKPVPRYRVSCGLPAKLRDEGLDDVVLLGMGGSSLASLVIGDVLGDVVASGPRLHVLDTTSPSTVSAVLGSIDFAKTAFLVSSKSGTTVEPLSLYAVFRAAADAALGREAAGRRFVAVTDPDSHLERLSTEEGFRATVSSPPTVGGRYSALTVFGLLPAALLGIDLERALASAQRWKRRVTARPKTTRVSNSPRSLSTRTVPGETS